MRFPILSIGLVLAFAFVANYPVFVIDIGLGFGGHRRRVPVLSPFLGWLGVFLTGSDTSSNALFGSLQASTAHQIGIDPNLTVAANTTGGVTGKMISLQSIAVAVPPSALAGKESNLFRFTVKHSLILCTIVGIMTVVTSVCAAVDFAFVY